MMARPSVAKSASLLSTLIGTLTPLVLLLKLFLSPSSPYSILPFATSPFYDESELDQRTLSSLRVLLLLLSSYLLASSILSGIGFLGVLRNRASLVRVYRDAASVDLAFTAFVTVVVGAAARAPAKARAACEQPELATLLSLLISAFNLAPAAQGPDDACERALQNAALVVFVGLVALTVVRLHFLLAVGTHYAALVREQSKDDVEGGEQRIRLLPLPRGVAASDVVYAPVHCPNAANSVLGTTAELWVRVPAASSSSSSSSGASRTAAAYAPAYLSPSPSPEMPAYAPAYVRSATAAVEPSAEEDDVPLGRGAPALTGRADEAGVDLDDEAEEESSPPTDHPTYPHLLRLDTDTASRSSPGPTPICI
ncbi:hypothetical protein MSAN_02333300 [Mycena sanguinolenta]|uniref:Uncharacterized protein n=1 Tax=Mycena sanguinolenta TaxID=230812 RepID=A0A8H7CF09_9AGAR|nr:hypothetical protein MSAN_02333300 [Mycena sanguinolenta]